MRTFAVLFVGLYLWADSAKAQDTVQVLAGWNIVGSVKSGMIPEVLATEPPGIITTSFYGYQPGAGYLPTDTLVKGMGYWIKSSADGLVIFSTAVPPVPCSTFVVHYGGTVYTAVQILGQCWLNKNLNVGVMIDSMQSPANNGTIEKYCYNDNPANCATYGGLYPWDEAMGYGNIPGAQGICPSGWHIPTDAEYAALQIAVNADGNALKALGQGAGGGAGTDTSGFSGLLAGGGGFGGYGYLTTHAFLWSSTELDLSAASAMHLYGTNSNITFDYTSRTQGSSVRCLRD